MSERYEKLTRYCNFCRGNLSKECAVPEALNFTRRLSFFPEGVKECNDVELSVSIGLRHWEGRNQQGPPDICPDCLKALTAKAAGSVFGWDLIDKVINEKVAEAKEVRRGEFQKVLEANFEPTYDAMMMARRQRKAAR